MKIQTISLDRIVDNPFRDMKLFPIDKDQVAALRDSINEHGFFGGVKARARHGKIELACGHHRIAAARKANLNKIDLVIDDMDDDQMIHLMVDENATQTGANPGAIMNEVAAITRRLIEVLLKPDGDFIQLCTKCFDGKKGTESARGRLLARLTDPAKDGGIGYLPVMRYLGDGNEDRSPRRYPEVREAISALKQSGRYDKLVDDELRKHPQPVTNAPPAKSKTVAKQPTKTRQRVLDERCATVFPNDHQFKAFREAVTTEAARRTIPVDQQFKLAKEIMGMKEGDDDEPHKEKFKRKQAAAPFIKKYVQGVVQNALKQQRDIDDKERERYVAEQREARIDDELYTAKASLRSLTSAIAKLIDLAGQFPAHPKIGGFSAKLDDLIPIIKQLSAKLK